MLELTALIGDATGELSDGTADAGASERRSGPLVIVARAKGAVSVVFGVVFVV